MMSEELQAKIDHLEDQINDLEIELDQSQDEVHQIHDELEQARSQNKALKDRIKELEAELKAYKEGIPIEEHHKDGRELWVGEKGDPWGSYFWCIHPNYWGEIGWQEECNRAEGYISRHPAKPTHIFYPLPQQEQEPTKGEE